MSRHNIMEIVKINDWKCLNNKCFQILTTLWSVAEQMPLAGLAVFRYLVT